MIKRCACIFTFVAFAVGIAWVIGNVLTDRWSWSQWILWIPTLAPLFLFVAASCIAIIAKSKRQIILLTATTLALFLWFSMFENRFFATHDPGHGLRLVGWTMSHPKKEVSKESAVEIVRLDADITLLTHGWYVRTEPSISNWLEPSGRKVINGPFTILTKVKPLEVRTLVASDGIYISLFILDTTEILGRELILWAIDLPSSLSIPKMKIANRVKRLLEKVDAPEPDIVIGDFNMTQNSSSIQTIFPTLRDASDDGGEGWIASFPIEIPLYHIDHILLDSKLRAVSYKLVNPKIGNHRIQVAEITGKN